MSQQTIGYLVVSNVTWVNVSEGPKSPGLDPRNVHATRLLAL